MSKTIPAPVYLIAIGAFALGMASYVTAGLIPMIEQAFNVQVAVAAQLVTAFTLAYGIGSPLFVAMLPAQRQRFGLLVALALLGAAWVFRWIVFMAVQTVPKFGAGLYLQSLPWGSDGVLGMVGVFGLVAALIAIVSTALFRFPPRTTLAAA